MSTDMVNVRRRTGLIASCVLITLFVVGELDEALAHYGRHNHSRHRTYTHRPTIRHTARPVRHYYHPPVIKLDPTKFEEVKCAAMNAYFEADENPEEMFESMFMIVFVTKHRADEARANEAMRLPFLKDFVQLVEYLNEHSVCMVTYARWQFSWRMVCVCSKCQKRIRLQDVPRTRELHEYKWELAQYATQVVMEGWAPKDIGLDASLSRATFYFNPDATRPRTACEFFYKPLVRLAQGGRIGGHVFYAFPTPEEQKKLDEVHKDPKDRCTPVDAIPDLVWKNPATP